MTAHTQTLVDEGPFQMIVDYKSKKLASSIVGEQDSYDDEYETRLQSVTFWMENEKIELLPLLTAAQEDLIKALLRHE